MGPGVRHHRYERVPQFSRRPLRRVHAGHLPERSAKVAADVRGIEFGSDVCGEHEIGLDPLLPRRFPLLLLTLAVFAENVSAQCREAERATGSPSLRVATRSDRSPQVQVSDSCQVHVTSEMDVLPRQRSELFRARAGEQRHHDVGMHSIASSELEHEVDPLRRQRLGLPTIPASRNVDHLNHVPRRQISAHRAPHGPVQAGVQLAQGVRAQLLAQAAETALHVPSRKVAKASGTESWNDMALTQRAELSDRLCGATR
jgi:hypothetical protein